MICQKHPNQKMIQLFTSWACDLCDPRTGQKSAARDDGLHGLRLGPARVSRFHPNAAYHGRTVEITGPPGRTYLWDHLGGLCPTVSIVWGPGVGFSGLPEGTACDYMPIVWIEQDVP